jgi:hypothetical protein
MEDKVAGTADALQNYDAEGTTFLFGVVPLVVIVVFAVVWFVIYNVKKKKLEKDLASAMIDDGESQKMPVSNFSTREMQDMDPTKPSQRISELKKTGE